MNFIEFLDFNNLQKNTKQQKEARKPLGSSKNKNVIINKDKHVEKIYEQEMAIMYDNINKGDYIKIIHNNNSIYNCYKGYIGEIKSYNKNSKIAIICILGLPCIRNIQLSASHFIKVYNVC